MSETNAEKYIGQTRTMNCGMSATIIDYRSYKDIDVQFEDRTIREHVSISAFNRRNISPPSTSIQPGNKHIGQTRTMNCGLKATVIAYRNYKDVDVKFENGIVRKHRGLDEFERQAISPIPPRKGKAIIGKTKIMNCGMKATITDYRNMNDIDVRFENGVIRKHIRMNSFNTCTIGLKDKFNSDSYIGQTNIMKCGMKATIIAYRKYADIDVQFEDNVICKHKSLSNFQEGRIGHPTNIIFGKYKLEKVAFQFHNKTYFYVTYAENDSEISEVMCIDDMKRKLPTLAH